MKQALTKSTGIEATGRRCRAWLPGWNATSETSDTRAPMKQGGLTNWTSPGVCTRTSIMPSAARFVSSSGFTPENNFCAKVARKIPWRNLLLFVLSCPQNWREFAFFGQVRVPGGVLYSSGYTRFVSIHPRHLPVPGPSLFRKRSRTRKQPRKLALLGFRLKFRWLKISAMFLATFRAKVAGMSFSQFLAPSLPRHAHKLSRKSLLCSDCTKKSPVGLSVSAQALTPRERFPATCPGIAYLVSLGFPAQALPCPKAFLQPRARKQTGMPARVPGPAQESDLLRSNFGPEKVLRKESHESVFSLHVPPLKRHLTT